MRNILMLVILLLLGTASVDAQSPPKPWEQHNALLNVDVLVRCEIIDTTIVSLQGPYFSWPERRVLATVRVKSVVFDEKEVLENGQTLTLLVPSLLDFDQYGPAPKPQTIFYPNFFVEHTEFYAGLIYQSANEWWVASSNHAYLSILPTDSPVLDEYQGWREAVAVGRSEALSLGADHLKLETESLNIRLIGGCVQKKQQVVEHIEPSANSHFFWRIWDKDGRHQRFYINAATGKLHD